MSKRFVSASLTAAALAFLGSLALAKPPDLPADTRETCEEERDIQGLPVSNDPVPELNTRRPNAPVDLSPCVDPIKDEHARYMFLIGERCRKNGDLDMAQNCYEEARRLCPESSYAAKAIRRLDHLKTLARAGSSEEQELNPKEAAEAQSRFAEERKLALQKQHTETRILYLIGERCREGGDRDMARRCYEEAVQLGPKCAYGRKALERLREFDANQNGEEASEPMDRPAPAKKKKTRRRSKRIKDWLLQTHSEPRPLSLELPAVDHLIVHDFDRLLADSEEKATDLMIVPEDVPAIGDEEEQEYPVMPCGRLSARAEPTTLFVEPAPRDLVVRVETAETGEMLLGESVDLSDWLRATVRSLNGVGSLRIDAARLGRLLAEGEGAMRALGCELVEDGRGNRYVVYPARK